MSVPDLISSSLEQIYRLWYRDLPARHFKRDERHLTKAIARYGFECNRRGWEFDALAIRRDLMDLLRKISLQDADIKYLPVYLEGAIDRHIRTRAEELSAQAKTIARHLNKTIANLKPGDIRQPTDTEILAVLYKDLKKRKSGPRTVPVRSAPKQNQLL